MSVMFKGLLRAAGLCACLCAPVHAAPPPSLDALRAMTPHERAAALQAAAHRSRPAPGLDTEPPALRILEVAPQVDATVAGAQLLVRVGVVDDLAGLQYVAIEAIHPESGPTLIADAGLLGGRLEHTARLALQPGPMTRPGQWELTRVWAQDMAGNLMLCEAWCVRGITGNQNTFTVRGRPLDRQPPTLQAGRLETPTIHLSQPMPGTQDMAPWARMTLAAADSGGAGVQAAQARLCLPDGLNCLVLQADDEAALARERRTFTLSGQTWAEMPRGSYRLHTIVLRDHALNQTEYLSSDFGGATDFATWFGSRQTIEIRR